MRPLTILLLVLAPLALGEGPEFDVASIKVSAPLTGGAIRIGPARGGPGTADPTHIIWDSATLKNVLMVAFDMKSYQVTGPDVLDSRYDFAIGVPEGATKEQVRVMWQNLLASRFGLKYHIEKKEFPVDDLVVGPRGHKLKVSTATATTDAPAQPVPPTFDKDGKPTMTAPGMMTMIQMGQSGVVVAHAMAKEQPMSALADMLSNQIGHPVVDKTGLTGKYDFEVEFAPTNIRLPGGAIGTRAAPATTDGAPELGLELHEAIQQKLGLRLVGSKGMLDVVVVDKAERVPTEN